MQSKNKQTTEMNRINIASMNKTSYGFWQEVLFKNVASSVTEDSLFGIAGVIFGWVIQNVALTRFGSGRERLATHDRSFFSRFPASRANNFILARPFGFLTRLVGISHVETSFP
jgi:hypothetical protein